VTSFAQHKLARDWLDRQLNASVPVGLPWASVLGFLRLVTNPRVFERPESIGDAWQQVRAWFAFARCDAWITKDALALTDMHSMIRTLKDVRKARIQNGQAGRWPRGDEQIHMVAAYATSKRIDLSTEYLRRIATVNRST